jgi:hypothetical protein
MKKGLLLIFFIIEICHFTFNIENCKSQWVQISGFPNNPVTRLINHNNNLFAGANKVYISTNSGNEWNIIYNTTVGVNALNIVNNNIWIGLPWQNYFTSNLGVNWENVNLNKFVYWFIPYNNKIFAGTESNGCYISSNNGTSWYQSGYIWDDVFCFLSLENKLFAGTSQGLYYTTNDGTTWIMTSIPGIFVFELISNNNKLLAGTQFGVYYSINNGENWEQSSFTIWVNSLTYSGQNIFAGTKNNGIYLSTNNGISWIQKNEGIGNQTVNTLTILNNYISAGTESSGIWKRLLSDIIGIKQIGKGIPSSFSLSQNYPNPFNPITKIRFEIAQHTPPYPLSRGENISLKVYDILGKEIATLVNETLQPGSYEVTFDGSNLPSGIYFYQLRAGDFVDAKKLVFLK